MVRKFCNRPLFSTLQYPSIGCRYIDGQHVKFDNATGVAPIPPEFYYTEPKRCIRYSDGHLKKALTPLDAGKLSYFAEKIQNLLAKNFMQRNYWVKMKSIVQALMKSLQDYTKHLWEKQVAVDNWRTNGPVNQENLELTTIQPTTVKTILQVHYQRLDLVLTQTPCYTPIDLCEFAPTERRQRFRWLNNIQVSVPIQLYRLRRKQISFVWKIPDIESSVQNLDVVKQVDQIVTDNYISQIASKTGKKFRNDVLITHEKALSIFDVAAIDLTDTEYETERNNNTAQFIQQFIQSGETISDAVVVENEVLIEKKESKFEKFWSALQSIIDNHVAVADERRHGTVQCVSPLCTSLRDLINQAEVNMYAMNPGIDKSQLHVPSREWIRRQFMPSNPRSKVAGAYKGRFNLKWTMQSRLLRKSHPDHHYGAKIISFVKDYAQL